MAIDARNHAAVRKVNDLVMSRFTISAALFAGCMRTFPAMAAPTCSIGAVQDWLARKFTWVARVRHADVAAEVGAVDLDRTPFAADTQPPHAGRPVGLADISPWDRFAIA